MTQWRQRWQWLSRKMAILLQRPKPFQRIPSSIIPSHRQRQAHNSISLRNWKVNPLKLMPLPLNCLKTAMWSKRRKIKLTERFSLMLFHMIKKGLTPTLFVKWQEQIQTLTMIQWTQKWLLVSLRTRQLVSWQPMLLCQPIESLTTMR